MDLFIASNIGQQRLGPGSVLLPGLALANERALLAAVKAIEAESPFRNMVTPGGFEMSVAMTNCGHLGWVTDRSGYRYDTVDPMTCKPWPVIPSVFLELAASAALAAGFAAFSPDACLINRYETGARMSLHQDKNEIDFSQSIVSVSLGVPAIFQFGGFKRTDKTQRILLSHGDVLVWGGPDRMRYHGILPLKQNHHPLLDSQRLNLTFRKAG
ncbi:MAG TPA: DNA oxidative demethylase AlkB [Methylophilaceae bacterium]|jgi:alkylated DNA repair protein (DNA oxidative demethylase)